MKANLSDINNIVDLINQLWPDLTLNESKEELEKYIYADTKSAFIHIFEGEYVGLALCSLRSEYVEGCNFYPVGYLEGIVVDKKYRFRGIANYLCNECEEWAKLKGCKEFASDCKLTNINSLQFHLNIGFKEENRIICFKKSL